MRPKHRILCVSSDESSLSQLAYCLHINGYHAIKAASGPEAITAFNSDPMIDLVIADANMPQMNGRQLVERLKRIRPYTAMMLLSNYPLTPENHWADAMIARKTCSTEELLQRIKVMSARKRGPRKGYQRTVVAA